MVCHISTKLQFSTSRRGIRPVALILWLAMASLLTIPSPAQPQPARTAAERLVTHSLFMPQLNRDKQIWIYLPPGYGRHPLKRYPVFYMQDGQTLFDPQLTFPKDSAIDTALDRELRRALDWYGSWQLNQQLDRLVNSGLNPGIIVVGISSNGGNRTSEYSPWPWYGALQAQADQYLEFLVHTVKPFIDTHYLTLAGRGHTGIGGSSLGGLLSLYGGLKYQQVFSRIAALSPVLIPEVSGQQLIEFIHKRGKARPMKIYVDLGSEELNFGPQQPLYEALRAAGFGEKELEFRRIAGGRHQISDWGRRFPGALLWLEP